MRAPAGRNIELEGSTISTSKNKSLSADSLVDAFMETNGSAKYEHNGGTLVRTWADPKLFQETDRTLREACVAEDLPGDAVRAGGFGAEVAAGGVAGAELGGRGRPLEHYRRGDPLAVRQTFLLVGETVVPADDAAGAADPADEAADVAVLGGGGGGAQSGRRDQFCGQHPDSVLIVDSLAAQTRSKSPLERMAVFP